MPIAPTLKRNNSAQLEHEATTSKIGDDQLFYCLQRGISEDDAISMIVNGFCKGRFPSCWSSPSRHRNFWPSASEHSVHRRIFSAVGAI